MDPPTREALGRLPPSTKRRIRAALDVIASDPASGKELQLELAGYRTYRVGRFRIVHRTNSMVRVVAIGPREIIYQEAARLLRPLAERKGRYLARRQPPPYRARTIAARARRGGAAARSLTTD